jgi:hypothetical protein
MSKAFLKIRHVLQNTGLGTLNPSWEKKVSSYVFIFYQLTDVLEELLAYLNKNHTDNTEYILACYQNRIDGFDTSVTTQGISITHNTKKHWHNLVHIDAKQVANHITANGQKGLTAIEEDNNNVDTNDEDEDEDEDSDTDNE